MPFIGALIGAAGSIIGSKIASNQASKATNMQLAAGRQAMSAIGTANQTAQRALDTSYGDQKALLSPYQQLGTGALGALSGRVGIAPPGTVAIRNPQDGKTYHIPQAQAPAAIQSGGVQI